MKPLRAGAARSALAARLVELYNVQFEQAHAGQILTHEQVAAILGGAIEASLEETFGVLNATLIGDTGVDERHRLRFTFWRHFEYKSWQLIQALKASNLIGKVK